MNIKVSNAISVRPCTDRLYFFLQWFPKQTLDFFRSLIESFRDGLSARNQDSRIVLEGSCLCYL